MEIERIWRRYVKPALLAMLLVASVVSLQTLLTEVSTRTILRTFLAVFPIIALIVGLERIVLRLGADLMSLTASAAKVGVYSISLTGFLSALASPFGW